MGVREVLCDGAHRRVDCQNQDPAAVHPLVREHRLLRPLERPVSVPARDAERHRLCLREAD